MIPGSGRCCAEQQAHNTVVYEAAHSHALVGERRTMEQDADMMMIHQKVMTAIRRRQVP